MYNLPQNVATKAIPISWENLGYSRPEEHLTVERIFGLGIHEPAAFSPARRHMYSACNTHLGKTRQCLYLESTSPRKKSAYRLRCCGTMVSTPVQSKASISEGVKIAPLLLLLKYQPSIEPNAELGLLRYSGFVTVRALYLFLPSSIQPTSERSDRQARGERLPVRHSCLCQLSQHRGVRNTSDLAVETEGRTDWSLIQTPSWTGRSRVRVREPV
jgi:hypothetical protein